MRNSLRIGLTVFLSFLLITPYELLAQAGQARDPHRIFRFNEIPDANYYSRDFVLVGLRPVRDVTNLDSDTVIRDNPQTQRGCLTRWLQPGQAVAAVTRPTIVTIIGGFGEAIRVTLKPGEPVVYDTSTKDILAVIRCCNKVTEGQIELPPAEVIEKIVEVEREVFVDRPSPPQIIEREIFVDKPPVRPPTVLITPPPERTVSKKKRGWLLPLIITGLGGGIIAAVLLNGDGPTPRKTYPREGVISPP